MSVRLVPTSPDNRIDRVLSDLATTMSSLLSTQQQIAGALRAAIPPQFQAEGQTTSKPRKQREHERGGAKWTMEEDEAVVSMFENGASVAEISHEQKRSWIAIVARLERLGYFDRNLRLNDLEPAKGAVEHMAQEPG